MVTNQLNPEALNNFYRDDGGGPESYPREFPVNYNVSTPSGHWKTGANWPPKGTELRLRQMAIYRKLFDGDLRDILPDKYPIVVNWFRRMSTHIADLIMAYPPTITSGAAADTNERLNDQLQDAIWQVVVDQSRYGTGLLRARRDGVRPVIEAVNPEYWFPAADADVLAITDYSDPTQGRILIDTHAHVGAHTRDEYELGSGSDSYAQPEGIPAGGALGARLRRQRSVSSTGRAIWPVPRLPASGEWGQSLYLDMIPLVAEYCRRLSKQGEVLNRHADPLLVFQRDPRLAPYSPSAPGEDEDVRVYSERIFLDRWRQSWISVVPPEFTDVKYISWDAQMQASFNHLANVEKALYATTQIPASLYGSLTGEVTAVGNVSLRKAYAPTYAYIRRLQGQITRAIIGVCRAATGREVEVEWPNAIEEFDKDIILNLGGQVDDEQDGISTSAMGFEVPPERD